MKKTSFLFLLLIMVVLCGCSLSTFQKMSPEEFKNTVDKIENSKLLILDIYHNRCESCKYIEPVIKKLEEDYSQNPKLVFLKYDLSNPFTIFDSRKLAKRVGLENIYKSQRFSGIVLIINPSSKQVLDSLVGEYNIDKYVQIIEKRLKEE